MRLARPPLPLQLSFTRPHACRTHKYRHKQQSLSQTDIDAHTKIHGNPCTQSIYQTSTHIQRMPTLGRWRSSTGDWCKLAGWRSVSLPDRESALGPPGLSSDLWGKLLAFLATLTSQGCRRQRERGRKRKRGQERESWRHYRIKQLRSPPSPLPAYLCGSLAWGCDRTRHLLVTSWLNASLN